MEGHQLVGVKEVKQVPNLEAILEDFSILGAGLVREVNVKNAWMAQYLLAYKVYPDFGKYALGNKQ